jgi:hypothetical protein
MAPSRPGAEGQQRLHALHRHIAQQRDELGAGIIDVHTTIAKDGEPLAPVGTLAVHDVHAAHVQHLLDLLEGRLNGMPSKPNFAYSRFPRR